MFTTGGLRAAAGTYVSAVKQQQLLVAASLCQLSVRSLTNCSSSMGDESAPSYKVFVGGLTWDLTNEELQSGEGGPLAVAAQALCWQPVEPVW